MHVEDAVPHWPKAISNAGYHHVNTEVWYYSESDPLAHMVCNSSGEDPKCSDSVYGINPDDHNTYIGIPFGCSNND